MFSRIVAGNDCTSASSTVASNDSSMANMEAEEAHAGSRFHSGHHVMWADESSTGKSLVCYEHSPPPPASPLSLPPLPPPPSASPWFSVQRIDASSIDQETFRREYADTPVVLTGCDLPQFITTEYLSRRYGDQV